MSRIIKHAFVAAMLTAGVGAASASPACLKEKEPYHLTGDSIQWSMKIVPGADCIQGLRWSYMQVYAVWVLKKPASGELVTVGPGFRYFAKPGFSGKDQFTLVVVGKNRHEEGFSTVEITVSPSDGAPPPGTMIRLESQALSVSKIADAAPPN
jgi:hypothetical protein